MPDKEKRRAIHLLRKGVVNSCCDYTIKPNKIVPYNFKGVWEGRFTIDAKKITRLEIERNMFKADRDALMDYFDVDCGGLTKIRQTVFEKRGSVV